MSIWDGFKLKLGIALYNFVEFAIFLAVILAITGVIMWLDKRRSRQK